MCDADRARLTRFACGLRQWPRRKLLRAGTAVAASPRARNLARRQLVVCDAVRACARGAAALHACRRGPVSYPTSAESCQISKARRYLTLCSQPRSGTAQSWCRRQPEPSSQQSLPAALSCRCAHMDASLEGGGEAGPAGCGRRRASMLKSETRRCAATGSGGQGPGAPGARRRAGMSKSETRRARRQGRRVGSEGKRFRAAPPRQHVEERDQALRGERGQAVHVGRQVGQRGERVGVQVDIAQRGQVVVRRAQQQDHQQAACARARGPRAGPRLRRAGMSPARP